MSTVLPALSKLGRYETVYACVLLGGAFFLIDLWLPLGVAGGVPHVAVVLISLTAPSPLFPIVVATATSLLTAVGYLLSPPGSEAWIVLTNRALALFAIWVTAALGVARAGAQAQLQASMVAELRTVSGLLPIVRPARIFVTIRATGGG